MADRSFQPTFLSPRYWPTWLGIGLMRLLCLLPVPWLLALGEGLGRFLGRLIPSRRHIVRRNLEVCFPQMPAAERERLVDEHFADLGAGIFEAALAWFASDDKLRPHGEVVGLEHLDAAMKDGHGVLLLTGHFTTLELGARYLCLANRPFHAMYRPYENKVMNHYMHHWREARSGLPALPREDLRRLVKALREGRCIWYAPDQTLDPRSSVFAPFFGHPALTVSATGRLAQMGRAKVVPYFPARVTGRYRVTFFPALEDFPGGDDVADTARVNQVLEEGVKLAPSQYFWVHRRFKKRPPGTPDVYAKG
ncbi:LpxL/LpxP family Kdo(2)-lipid IV(A) lauroyl/palmitoleoyl acyltransferase [Solimonas sp. SE-A11]|uniref:LpxL/LpxP family Kdo(2)-lipid IV(A) lauroyl/palmitoleoyl acyltransferase n=1 Tax=Solimonas sp. SE-A11 TaxID=3054954 RepID=UPI00259D04F3|nr:LpxL/LpxP family Kdo(2)-lipid IV(A) lauroyl/palmitoleoyl acyltransferase [Solimonas sp. SE-A11]MDM4771632.1 LpxL/LpxP family Kdo(2)-lipid IV(A) lauroyl/palmitoleoyl acyltransferase [Solimonas sp. SE-A11]